MDERTKLHVKRLRVGLEQIIQFRQDSENAFSTTFKGWKQHVKQSLGELFGSDHDYTKQFSRLNFCEFRSSIGKRHWTYRDQEKIESDLSLAEQILSDALEEFEIAPPVATAVLERASTVAAPQIIVNVNNVLSQTVEVEINQVLASLGDLDLSEEEHTRAEKYAKELAKETKGQQRWSVLSKSLDALKAIGKSVYERVAIPLILEMLKKQAGL